MIHAGGGEIPVEPAYEHDFPFTDIYCVHFWNCHAAFFGELERRGFDCRYAECVLLCVELCEPQNTKVIPDCGFGSGTTQSGTVLKNDFQMRRDRFPCFDSICRFDEILERMHASHPRLRRVISMNADIERPDTITTSM